MNTMLTDCTLSENTVCLDSRLRGNDEILANLNSP